MMTLSQMMTRLTTKRTSGISLGQTVSMRSVHLLHDCLIGRDLALCVNACARGAADDCLCCPSSTFGRCSRAAASGPGHWTSIGPVGPNREVPDFSWATHVKNMGEAEFKLRYRVSWESFNKLLKILEPKLRVDNERQACNSRQGIPVELPTRLAIALRYFAGGDPLDLKLIYGVSKAFVMTCVWRAVDAINGCLDNVRFPLDDAAGLAALEADFAAASRGGFWRGQVGAIDGPMPIVVVRDNLHVVYCGGYVYSCC